MVEEEEEIDDPEDGAEPMEIDAGSDVTDGIYCGTVPCSSAGFNT